MDNLAADPAVREILAPPPGFTRIFLERHSVAGPRRRGIFAPTAGAVECRDGEVREERSDDAEAHQALSS